MARLLYSLDVTKLDTTHFTATLYLLDDEFVKLKQQLNDIKNAGAFTSFTLALATAAAPLSLDQVMRILRDIVPHQAAAKVKALTHDI